MKTVSFDDVDDAEPTPVTPASNKPEVKKCLKCGHVRQPTDLAPDYECPQCGAIYAKVEAAMRGEDHPSQVRCAFCGGMTPAAVKKCRRCGQLHSGYWK